MPSSNIIHENILELKLERSDFFIHLNECRKNKEFDVQLQIGEKLFDAHRTVLSFYSPILKAMITNQCSTTKICLISEKHVDVEIMEDLLSFLYTGSIKLTSDNVFPVCAAAHFLQISTLLEPIVKHLSQLITVENVLKHFEFSITHQLERLRDCCLRLVSNHNVEILQSSQILELSSKVFKALIVGLKPFRGESLRENIFDCIIRWTETDHLERFDELPVLLKNIPLQKLPFKFLNETVATHPLLKVWGGDSAMKTVSSALVDYHAASSLIVFGYKDFDCKESSIFHYNPKTRVWKELPNMLEPRQSYGFTVVNGRDIVVCGGFANRKNSILDIKLSSVEMFEWATKTWKKLPDMPHAVGCCSVAVLNENLYVVGDNNHTVSGIDLSAVLCYSFETQQWKYVKPMNYGRNYCQLIEYDNYLYAFGGGTHVVERYDPGLDEWTCLETKSSSNKFKKADYEWIIAATIHQDKIYVGKTFSSFDPETNTWNKFPKTFFGVDSSLKRRALVSMNGRLLAVWDHSKWIYEFNFSIQRWRKFCEMDSRLKKPSMIVGAFN